MRTTPTRLFLTGLWFASTFAYQLTANVILLTDERSITAYARDGGTSDEDGPHTSTPSVPFGWFYSGAGARAINWNDVYVTAGGHQNSRSEPVGDRTRLSGYGSAYNSQPIYDPGVSTFADSSSIYKIGFVLDEDSWYDLKLVLRAYITTEGFFFKDDVEAGASLIGPLGEVFSFAVNAEPYGPLSNVTHDEHLTGLLVPGSYVLEAWAKVSSVTYKERFNGAASYTLDFTAPIAIPDAGCPAWLCAGTLLGLLLIARRLQPGHCFS